MDTKKISDEIAKLKRASKEASTSILKNKLNAKIEALKKIITDSGITTKQLAVMLLGSKSKIDSLSPAEWKETMKRLSARSEYWFLKGMSKGKVKDDLKREAKPVGWRFKGRGKYRKPTKSEVIAGRKRGTVYYENRPERSDVVHPAKLKTGDTIKGPNTYNNRGEWKQALMTSDAFMLTDKKADFNFKLLEGKITYKRVGDKINAYMGSIKIGVWDTGLNEGYIYPDKFKTGGEVDESTENDYFNSGEMLKDVNSAISWMSKNTNEWAVRDTLIKFTHFGFYKGNVMASIDEETARKIITQLKEYVKQIEDNKRNLNEVYAIIHFYSRKFKTGGGVGDKIAIYKNKVLNETHKMGGLRDLGHAWDMAEYVAKRKGWNPMDIHVTLEKKMATGGGVDGGPWYLKSDIKNIGKFDEPEMYKYGTQRPKITYSFKTRKIKLVKWNDAKSKEEVSFTDDISKAGIAKLLKDVSLPHPNKETMLAFLEEIKQPDYNKWLKEKQKNIIPEKIIDRERWRARQKELEQLLSNFKKPKKVYCAPGYLDCFVSVLKNDRKELNAYLESKGYIWRTEGGPNSMMRGSKSWYEKKGASINEIKVSSKESTEGLKGKGFSMATGGGVGEVVKENKEMVMNSNFQIMHHTKELEQALKSVKVVPAWVVAKIYDASEILSDVTHYLDGESKMKTGGKLIGNQNKLDLNKNGRLDAEDFKMLRRK